MTKNKRKSEMTIDEISDIEDIKDRVEAYKALIESSWKKKLITKKTYPILIKFFDQALVEKDKMSIDALARRTKIEIKNGKLLKELSDAKKFLVSLVGVCADAIKSLMK